VADAGTRRTWQVAVAGRIVGTLEGVRSGDEVRLNLALSEDGSGADGTQSAQGALGQMLGQAFWGPDVEYVIDSADPAVQQAAVATGFLREAGSRDDRGLWRRSAPRTKPARDSITRFLDGAGRIDRYPVSAADRRELLAWVAHRAFVPADVLTEAEVNDRLRPYAPDGDVAVLRRYLVDHELLERTRSGSEYAPVASVRS